ncbi:hypothetical protein AMTRI_Chr02g214510 [Amborella trichopoda]
MQSSLFHLLAQPKQKTNKKIFNEQKEREGFEPSITGAINHSAISPRDNLHLIPRLPLFLSSCSSHLLFMERDQSLPLFLSSCRSHLLFMERDQSIIRMATNR